MTAAHTPGTMLVSRERDLWAQIDSEQVRNGRFLTEHRSWLRPHVAEFIAATGAHTALDPFAGEGHLLEAVLDSGLVRRTTGFDITGGDFTRNDSLDHIPATDALIVTNPPYLARHSARRKRVLEDVVHWFDRAAGSHADLYQVALERMLDAAADVVAILPETFIHTRTFRDRLASITVLERHHPFSRTACPVVVACFSAEPAAPTSVWIDDEFAGTLNEVDLLRRAPFERLPGLRFNVTEGQIGLRAIDGSSGCDPIAFLPTAQFTYHERGIKHSSRLMTRIEVPGAPSRVAIERMCAAANAALGELRSGVGELALSPFKGNDLTGRRRRRLDYRQAARILSAAVSAERDRH